MRYFFILALLAVTAPVYGVTVECKAKVTNRRFDITLDTESRVMEARSDNGYVYRGTTNYYFSPRAQEEDYFLPTGFASGMELAFELKGQHRIAFCRKSNECYLCRPSRDFDSDETYAEPQPKHLIFK